MRILLVDDEPGALAALSSYVRGAHEVDPCDSGRVALARLQDHAYDLLVTDLSMPPPDGFDLLHAAPTLAPGMPVVVVTAHDTARAAVQALRLGARDYLVKPATREQVETLLTNLFDSRGGGEEQGERYGLTGHSAAIRGVRQLVPLLAHGRETVLVTGESGSGKEHLARVIHAHSARAQGPFVTHAIGATAPEMVEGVLFGGARAVRDSGEASGLFERAHGGTLYLAGVEACPLALQIRLLQAIEGGMVRRAGEREERPVDVRVIAATTVDLGDCTARQRFRADLYFRLRQLEVAMPPLRDRLDDLPMLVERFLAETEAGAERVPRVTRTAMAVLRAHHWPGNCCELRNALRSAQLLAAGQPIQPGHLPQALASGSRGVVTTLAAAEREHIRQALQLVHGNRSQAARVLGIDRGTLARKIRQMGLEAPLS